MSDQYPQYQPPAATEAPVSPQGQPGDRRPLRRVPRPARAVRYRRPVGRSSQYGDPGLRPLRLRPPAGRAGTVDAGPRLPLPAAEHPSPAAPAYARPASGTAARPSPAATNAASAKGFLAALFDFNFDTFITPKIIKAVYIVVTVIIGLTAVGFLLSAVVSGEPGFIVLALGAACPWCHRLPRPGPG